MNETTQRWIPAFGDVLRGEKDHLSQLQEEHNLGVVLRQSLVATVGCGIVFGVALGSYGASLPQLFSSGVKVPLLLLGTTALCFPSFHVLQTVKATRPMSLAQSAALQATALSTTSIVWAALSLPLFFLVGTTGHYTLAQFLALAPGRERGRRSRPAARTFLLQLSQRAAGIRRSAGPRLITPIEIASTAHRSTAALSFIHGAERG